MLGFAGFYGEINFSERVRNTKLAKEYVIMNEDALIRKNR